MRPLDALINYMGVVNQPPVSLVLSELVTPDKRNAWEKFGPYHYTPNTFNVASRCFLATRCGRPIGMAACLPLPSGSLKNAWRSHKVVVLPEFRHEWRTLADAQAKLMISEGKRFFCNASDAPPELVAYRDERASGWIPTSTNGRRPSDAFRGDELYGTKSRATNANGVIVSHEYLGRL